MPTMIDPLLRTLQDYEVGTYTSSAPTPPNRSLAAGSVAQMETQVVVSRHTGCILVQPSQASLALAPASRAFLNVARVFVG